MLGWRAAQTVHPAMRISIRAMTIHVIVDRSEDFFSR
jgi:hypothetical protein